MAIPQGGRTSEARLTSSCFLVMGARLPVQGQPERFHVVQHVSGGQIGRLQRTGHAL